MAGISTSTTLTELSTTASAQGYVVMSSADVWNGLVTEKDLPKGASTANVPVYGGASAASTSSPGEGVDLDAGPTWQQMDSGSGGAITIAEYVAGAKITNKAKLQSVGDLDESAIAYLGDAMARAKSAALVSASDGWSTTDVGAAGIAMTAAHFESALQTLRGNAAPGNLYCVTGAEVAIGTKGITTKIFGLSNNQYALSAGIAANELNKTGYIGSVYGFNVFIDSTITPDVNDDEGAYFFAKTGLVWGEQQGFTISIDVDNSYRAKEYVATIYGGADQFVSSHGVQGLFDVS
jgi:hypothetical protein